MRAFKIWNKTRTSSFNLSGLNVITTNVAGLGNKFTNDLYDSRIKKHLISQTNSFEQINLTVNFGVHSNAYQKYREFMNFIQANGRNILVIEYYTPGASRFVDVVLSNASKNQKTGFGVLVETVSFDRLTPYYILQRRTGRSVLVSNRYLENVVPRLELKNNLYPTGTKIRVGSKNEGIPDLTGKTEISTGVYRIYTFIGGVTLDYNIHNRHFILNGTSTQQDAYSIRTMQAGTHTLSFEYVSGSMAGSVSEIGLVVAMPPPDIGGTYVYVNKNTNTGESKTYTHDNLFYLNLILWSPNEVYNNYTFKIQLEKAGNALELDRPIDELKGYTLREVFEDGALMPRYDSVFDSYLNWTTYEGAFLSQNQAVLVDDNYAAISHASNQTVSNYNNIYYLKYEVLFNSLGNSLLKTGGYSANELFVEKTFNSSVGIHSTIIQSKNTGLMDRIFFYITPYTTGQINLKNIFIYNLTSLGISHLTAEQMDHWFNQYQILRERPTEYSKPITTTQEIELNESVLSNQELIIDSENKTVTLNGANAYQITNKDKSTFLNLPEGDYLVECDTPITVEYKRWVID